MSLTQFSQVTFSKRKMSVEELKWEMTEIYVGSYIMFKKTKKSKKISIDEILLQEICKVLQSDEITAKERGIFEDARQGLIKKEYYLKVARDLRQALTPIVVKRESTKEVSEFYSTLTSPDFMSKGLGGLVAFSAPGIGW